MMVITYPGILSTKAHWSQNIIEWCDFMNVNNSSQASIIIVIKYDTYKIRKIVQVLMQLLCPQLTQDQSDLQHYIYHPLVTIRSVSWWQSKQGACLLVASPLPPHTHTKPKIKEGIKEGQKKEGKILYTTAQIIMNMKYD